MKRMSSSKQPTRVSGKTFDSVSSFPLISERNNNNNTSSELDELIIPGQNRPLEVTLFECEAASILRDFAPLFPAVELFRQKRSFRLLLFTFATANDMTGWNKEVEEERDRLHQIFLRIGDAVVSRLVDDDAGFWADFVDPVGGKPHRSAYCNDNLFEIDPRLRPFGVKVEDLGCCKCVRLEKFGSKAFVGCVFTDAPFDAPVWQELLG